MFHLTHPLQILNPITQCSVPTTTSIVKDYTYIKNAYSPYYLSIQIDQSSFFAALSNTSQMPSSVVLLKKKKTSLIWGEISL